MSQSLSFILSDVFARLIFLSSLCRMSIAIAIARVFPAKEPMRRFTIGLAVLFGLMFAALQITTACIGSPVTPSSASTPGRHQCQWVPTFVHSYLFSAYLVAIMLPICFDSTYPDPPILQSISSRMSSSWGYRCTNFGACAYQRASAGLYLAASRPAWYLPLASSSPLCSNSRLIAGSQGVLMSDSK
jgi:hypothetical protein